MDLMGHVDSDAQELFLHLDMRDEAYAEPIRALGRLKRVSLARETHQRLR